MCGNVGVLIAKNNYAVNSFKTAFKNLLIIDQLRGIHGTGIFGVDYKLTMRVEKQATDAISFLSYKKTDELINWSDIILAGHNRYATQGSHVRANTHPFTKGHITLFHNGTLYDVKELDNKKFGTDSEAIANTMSIRGVKQTLGLLDGAFALVWWDAKAKTLNFARNTERPLYLAYTKNSYNDVITGIIWASEKEMIELACTRNNITIDRIEKLKEGVWVAIDPLSLEEERTDFEFIDQSFYSNYYGSYSYGKSSHGSSNPNRTSHYYNSSNNYSTRYIRLTLERESVVKPLDGTVILTGTFAGKTVLLKGLSKEHADELLGQTKTYQVESETSNVIKLVKPEEPKPQKQSYEEEYIEYRLGPNNTIILEEEYNQLIENGCYYCGADLTEIEDYEITFDYADNAICPRCASEESKELSELELIGE